MIIKSDLLYNERFTNLELINRGNLMIYFKPNAEYDYLPLLTPLKLYCFKSYV